MRQDTSIRFRARQLLWLIGLFAVSRGVIYGLRPIYAAPLQFYMQYLDVGVLRERLLHGVWHLHTQPPLFNLFLGLVLKVSPAGMERHVFAGIYFALGLGTVVLLYAILCRLGVRGWLAVAGALVYALLPSTIQAERWLFYTCPVTFLLTASVYTLMRFADTGCVRWYALFAGLCATIVLTRSFFHLVLWMLPVLVGTSWVGYIASGAINTRGRIDVLGTRNRLPLLDLLKRLRQGVGRVRESSKSERGSVASKCSNEVCFRFGACSALALLALLIAAYPYILNAARYGMFTASTWQGMSIAKMTRYVPADEVEALIAGGKITPLARIPSFEPPWVYLDYYGGMPATGVDVLDAVRKSTGEANWNHRVYVRASREYQRNSIAILLRHPWAYAKAVLNEVYLFFGLRSHVYLNELRAWILGEHFIAPVFFREGLILFAAPVLYLLLFVGGVTGWIRRLPEPVAIYALFLILYAFGLACLAELGEGGYMRIPIEPLLVVGCVLLVEGRR